MTAKSKKPTAKKLVRVREQLAEERAGRDRLLIAVAAVVNALPGEEVSLTTDALVQIAEGEVKRRKPGA